MEDGDQVVVYASGHGVRVDDDYFIVPQDGRDREPETLVGWSTLKDWLTRASRIGRKVLILHTCAGGPLSGQSGKNA